MDLRDERSAKTTGKLCGFPSPEASITDEKASNGAISGMMVAGVMTQFFTGTISRAVESETKASFRLK